VTLSLGSRDPASGLVVGGTRRGRGSSRASSIVGLYGVLALVGVAIAGLRGDWNIYRLPGSRGWLLVVSPLIGVAVGLAVVFLSRLAVTRFTWARQLHRDFRGIVGDLPGREILLLAIASAIGEELLFRGALQPWLGLGIASLIFALLHIGPGLRFLPWTVSALVMGLVFGLLARDLGDLGAPIAAHFTINFLNLRYIVRTELSAS
jgi:membrane protease YdiL (CAAX protease family)